MRRTGIALIAALALMIAVPAYASVHNVTLTGTGTAGVSGMATVMVGDVTGTNPYHNVEINIRMDSAPAANQVYEAWLVDSKNNVKRSIGAFSGLKLTTHERFTHFTDSGPFDSVQVALEQAHSVCAQPVSIVSQGTLPGTALSAADFRTMAILPDYEPLQRQLSGQRYNLSDDQITNLRMMAFSYPEINMVANAASRCKKSVTDVAMMVSQGQSWDDIARSCNTTTAMLMEPVPMQAVAGSRQEVGMAPGTGVMPMFYQRYVNGRAVVTMSDWNRLHKAGYTWREVAVAANIAARTGEDVDNILRMARVQGMTFDQIAMDRGIAPSSVMDVSAWPFGETRVDEHGTVMPDRKSVV